jgi:5-dehydro-2-deoxygluconokinase
VAEQADALGLATFMDLDLRPTDWAHPSEFGEVLRPVLSRVDVVIGTEEELYAALAPDPGPVMDGAPVPEDERDRLEGSLADLLEAGGGHTVVVKRGPRGVTVLNDGDRVDVPGFPVQAINTVGAGDAFASGLIRSRLLGWDWYRSARFGNACGAIEVTRHGCSIAFPREPEVVDFMGGSS